jgi:WD40 repeat protein
MAALEGHKSNVFACDWSPDSQKVVSASRDNNVGVWIANTGQVPHTHTHTTHTHNTHTHTTHTHTQHTHSTHTAHSTHVRVTDMCVCAVRRWWER